jgi:hypothetical protein
MKNLLDVGGNIFPFLSPYGSTAPFRVSRPPHFEVSRSYSDTPHFVVVFWTRDQLVAERRKYYLLKMTPVHGVGLLVG